MPPAEPPLLARLSRETYARVHKARMISGHAQGRLLSLLSKLMMPRRVLEIGTFTGYSALCLAEGLAPDGALHTIDINDELAALATRYFAEAGLAARIHGHWGQPATAVLPTLSPQAGPWDLVFIDADKEQNQRYFDLVIDHVRPGGLLIVDNVLWYGKVVDAYLPTGLRTLDKETRAVRSFNDSVVQDSRVEPVLLPVRDGLLLLRKASPPSPLS
ncbi:MAG: O-methyltransferase [Hymenobacteraceae bacterium]|nr:O-methyltransferase [Hymenobacteraceae bacterium]